MVNLESEYCFIVKTDEEKSQDNKERNHGVLS